MVGNMSLPKGTIKKIDGLLDMLSSLMQVQLYDSTHGSRGAVIRAVAGGPGPFHPTLTPEEQDLYDGLMADLGPEMQRQAEELIKTEMRGNWTRVKEFLKSGKKAKLVRKREGTRDSLFLQFGDGVETEIEEFRILG